MAVSWSMARVRDLVGVQPGVVVGAWVAVGGLVVDHVPDRDEHGVLDGDDGLEGAAAGGDAPVSLSLGRLTQLTFVRRSARRAGVRSG
jgi:hypothetical protein